MPGLSIQHIWKSYGRTQALRDISYEVQPGEILALLGPSGCGKSTLLNIVAGLETPDGGDCSWDGKSLMGIPPHQRGFGLMFQDYALFPHMNILANIAFGLRIAGWEEAEVKSRVEEMLTLVGLPGFGGRDVNTLSGGEQQRVALARSLAPRPRLLMLDEPLGSLDRALRERLTGDLRTILKGMQQTAIYVTHDQEEAFALADRVVLMNAGSVEQIGTPQEIYCAPASPFAARFLELTNLLPMEIVRQGEQVIAKTAIGDLPLPAQPVAAGTLLIRPDQAVIGDGGPVVLRGKVQEVSFRGSWQRLTLLVKATPLTFHFSSATSLPAPGQPLSLSLEASRSILLFP